MNKGAIQYDIDIIDEFDELNLVGEKQKAHLKRYYQYIDKIASKSDSRIIAAENYYEKAIGLSTMFLHAKEKIKIFQGDLNDEICRLSIWHKAIEFSASFNKLLYIEILIENEPRDECNALKSLLNLRESFPDRVKLYKIRPSELINLQDIKMHFTVCDNNKIGFKLEDDGTDICSFNDPSKASRLIDLFTLFKGYSTNYSSY